MASTATDQAPNYSAAVLDLLGIPAMTTAALAIASMQTSLRDAGWQQKFPKGFVISNAVELKGVCVKTDKTGEWGPRKLTMTTAHNSTVPDTIMINNALVLTLDGAKITSSQLLQCEIGTRLYAKRIIVHRRVAAPPIPFGGQQSPPVVYWDLLVGKFLTVDQVSCIEDWTNLP